MQRTTQQLANLLGLSFGTMNVILSRPEFYKYRDGAYFNINRDFAENLYIYLNKRRKSKRFLYEKYKDAEIKLYNWRRKL